MDKDSMTRRPSLLDVQRFKCQVRKPRNIDYFGIPICSKHSTGASPDMEPSCQNSSGTFEIELQIDNSESTGGQSTTEEAEKQPLIFRDRVKSVAFTNTDWKKVCMAFGSANVFVERGPEPGHNGDNNEETSTVYENATEAMEETDSAVSHLVNIKREIVDSEKVVNKIDENADNTNKHHVEYETNSSNRNDSAVKALNCNQEYDDRNDIDVDFGPYSPEAEFGNVSERIRIKTESEVEILASLPPPDAKSRMHGETNESGKDGDSQQDIGYICSSDTLKTNKEKINCSRLNQKSATEKCTEDIPISSKLKQERYVKEIGQVKTGVNTSSKDANDIAGKEKGQHDVKDSEGQLQTKQISISNRTSERPLVKADCMMEINEGKSNHGERKDPRTSSSEVNTENFKSIKSISVREQHQQAKKENFTAEAKDKTKTGKTKTSLFDNDDHSPVSKRRHTGSEESTILSPTSHEDKQSPLKNKVTYQIIKQRDINDSPVKKTYVCDICNMDIFKSKYDILTHKAEHHWL